MHSAVIIGQRLDSVKANDRTHLRHSDEGNGKGAARCPVQ
jgi:hypothetical protein